MTTNQTQVPEALIELRDRVWRLASAPDRMARLHPIEQAILRDLLDKPVADLCATCDKWLRLYLEALQ